MIKVNLINQYDDNNHYQDVIEEIISAAYEEMTMVDDKIINVILVDNKSIHQYNLSYRNIDRETDVISFENKDMQDELGDILISIDKTKEQAKDYQHSFERELAFLTLHGFLHCLGYDHLNKKDEKEMFALQDKIIENTRYRRKDHYEKTNA
jgi:probable rRNA maturation factor